jgi:hypothetical protein
MKMFRNLSIFVLAFLSILVVSFYGCQKEGVNNAIKPQQIVETRGVCTDPIFPAITKNMQGRDLKNLRLFDYRYAVALYRFHVKIYGNFSIRLNKAGIPLSISTADLNTWGLSDIVGIIDTKTIDGILRQQFLREDGWTAVKNFLDAGFLNIDDDKRTRVINRANTWEGASNEGSYTIFFASGNSYSGKGDKSRCLKSSLYRCGINAMDTPIIADSQPAALNFSTTYERQAYKEEAIRMYISGYEAKNNAGNTYNINNSPGKNHIIKDGY